MQVVFMNGLKSAIPPSAVNMDDWKQKESSVASYLHTKSKFDFKSLGSR